MSDWQQPDAENDKSDDEILSCTAPATDERWRELFALPVWSERREVREDEIVAIHDLLYGLQVIVPFNWPKWYSPRRYPHGAGLDAAPVADAVRLITSYVRGDRFSEGELPRALSDGSIHAAVHRLWSWYRQELVGKAEFVDWSEYSDDRVYRWSYERRWAPGAALCWVGLNPGTGDTDSGPRPTLRKVVGWARREGCAAVRVVNLFSYRSTDPRALQTSGVDIVGHGTDEAIRSASSSARVTLVAWGADKLAAVRGVQVMTLVTNPVCVGVTKSGNPRHPLYVAATTPFEPYDGGDSP